MKSVKQWRLNQRGQRGFTLVELLIVILIVGVLAAVAVPLFLGYAKEARLAEAKALAGSALTSLSVCVQVRGPGQSCVRGDIAARVGVDASGDTCDDRWRVTVASLTVDTSAPPVLDGVIRIQGAAGRNHRPDGAGDVHE